MNAKDFDDSIRIAMGLASRNTEWNAVFELLLTKMGLQITTIEPEDGFSGHYVMSPMPVIGCCYKYEYPSWIVEA